MIQVARLDAVDVGKSGSMFRKMIAAVGCVGLLSSMTACAGPSDDSTPTTSSTVQSSSPETTEAVSPSPVVSTPSSVETTPSATAAPTPSPTASESSDGANGGEIPQSVQGNWARVDDADVNSVKAEQCDNATAAPGSFITIDATSIQYFETISVLESVEKSDAQSLLGQFSQQNGDAVYTTRIRLDSQDDGRTLITTDDEQPGPTRYLRCPA